MHLNFTHTQVKFQTNKLKYRKYKIKNNQHLIGFTHAKKIIWSDRSEVDNFTLQVSSNKRRSRSKCGNPVKSRGSGREFISGRWRANELRKFSSSVEHGRVDIERKWRILMQNSQIRLVEFWVLRWPIGQSFGSSLAELIMFKLLMESKKRQLETIK